MDRNSIIGLLIIGAIIIIFSIVSSPSKEDVERAKKQQDSAMAAFKKTNEEKEKILTLEKKKQDSLKNLPDTTRKSDLKDKYGSFAPSTEGSEEFVTIENNLIKIKISNKGGRIYSAQLKHYHTWDGKPLLLFDGANNEFGLNFFSQNKSISTNDLFFTPSTAEKHISSDKETKSLSMKLLCGDKGRIEYLYSLEPNSYMLKFKMNFSNLDSIISNNASYLTLNWKALIPGLEKGVQWESDNTSIYWKLMDEEVNYLNERSEDVKENLKTKVKWIAYKQQFFSTILVADSAFLNAQVHALKADTASHCLKKFMAEISLPYEKTGKQSIPMKFYFGPNQVKILKQFNLEFEQLVPLGWAIFKWVNQFLVIPIFNFLGSYISNYGLIIFLLTIIIKILLFPLTYKSYLSSAKMRVLKPQVDELNKKIPKEKTMERQQAAMALYKKVGVNPMGGCIPILLQFPILIALFRFFPASIELRQQSFLWATDLSTYDSICSWSVQIPFVSEYFGNHLSLFTLLMCGSLILTTLMNSEQMAGTSQMPGMKVMMWMMPVMMLLWFNNYAAGLSYYYFLANMITFLQTIIIRRFVDDKKILSQLEANKAKPVKRSKFQQRLEEMAKKRGYKLPKK
ncbi:MAG: membrane protein insertase YidC [Bacteroidia bacterium]|nr:membrane protein insertase YidC [Bacteroidia bacterium]